MAVNLTYRRELYLGESIRAEKLDKIKKKLETRPSRAGEIIIAVSGNSSDQLDIYAAKQLARRYYEKYPPYVVGIAGSYDEAVKLVERMALECLRERGDCALKEYLLCGT